MEVELRRAREDDLWPIVRLLAEDDLGSLRETLAVEGGEAYRAAFDAITADPRQLLVVAESDSEVIGTLQLSFIPYLTYRGGERAQIEAVRVTAAFRSRGVGRQMIECAIEQAQARGCHLVQLTTDRRRSDARRFYESLGFEATHDGMKLHLSDHPAG